MIENIRFLSAFDSACKIDIEYTIVERYFDRSCVFHEMLVLPYFNNIQSNAVKLDEYTNCQVGVKTTSNIF